MTETATEDDRAMAAQELSFFRAALGAFAKSAAHFQVVCTAADGRQSSQLLQPLQPRASVQRLVVLDSSFNPPTVAHMQMAAAAVQNIQKQQQPQSSCRLLLLLSVNNADKAPKPVAFEQRLAMMLAAAKDMHRRGMAGKVGNLMPMPSIDIGLTSEPYFPDKSSAIAASDFYAIGGETAKPEEVFLVGFDTLIRIFDAKYYTASRTTGDDNDPSLTPMQAALTPFLRRSRLHVTTRPDDQWGSEAKQWDWLQTLAGLGGAEDWVGRVDLISNRYRGKEVVSSTMARAAAKACDWGQLASYVSPSVLSWIESQKLYRE